jgi:colicin import membrane protein
MRPTLLVLLLFVALPASASDFGARYPAGSISDSARAETALREADAEESRIERDSKAREAECHKGFLVNRCRDAVRRDKLSAEREVRRVRVEAHDLERKLKAEAAARSRAEAATKAEQAVGPSPAKAPGKDASTGSSLTPEEEARNRADYEKRIADKQMEAAREQARAQERADNERAYREKQAEAERRAQQKAAERKQAEERRAERRKQVEAQEAQREEVRRRAEAAAKGGGSK